jgi:hypothetical protein
LPPQQGLSRRLSAAGSGLGGVGLGDLDRSHPLDMTPGDLASLGLKGGKAGRPGRAGEVGVHGDAPVPGDDEVRVVQVRAGLKIVGCSPRYMDAGWTHWLGRGAAIGVALRKVRAPDRKLQAANRTRAAAGARAKCRSWAFGRL